MYRIPADLDLSPAVGEFTTQFRVGAFDLQFTLGSVNFAVESRVELLRGGTRVAEWESGRWPEPGFFELFNATVERCEAVSDRVIENGLTLRLFDDSDQYESMQITVDGGLWVI